MSTKEGLIAWALGGTSVRPAQLLRFCARILPA